MRYSQKGGAEATASLASTNIHHWLQLQLIDIIGQLFIGLGVGSLIENFESK